MLRSAKELHGWTLHATDGDIGHVEDLYFDDQQWTVRYLVVNTGTWLFGRRVLISPHAVTGLHWDRRAIDTRLTREQVANSPDIDTEKPVSRQQEWSYFGYYGWPIYWSGGLAWGAAAYPGLVVAPPITVRDPERLGDVGAAIDQEADASHYDTHLRSTTEVSGYGVVAQDGELGHVDDFLFDERSWTIRYVVVATRNFLPGRKVVVPPGWLVSVTWSAAKVRIDHPREEIRSAPEWNPAGVTDREYETRLHAHYDRTGYWAQHEDTEEDEEAETAKTRAA